MCHYIYHMCHYNCVSIISIICVIYHMCHYIYHMCHYNSRQLGLLQIATTCYYKLR